MTRDGPHPFAEYHRSRVFDTSRPHPSAALNVEPFGLRAGSVRLVRKPKVRKCADGSLFVYYTFSIEPGPPGPPA